MYFQDNTYVAQEKVLKGGTEEEPTIFYFSKICKKKKSEVDVRPFGLKMKIGNFKMNAVAHFRYASGQIVYSQDKIYVMQEKVLKGVTPPRRHIG